MAGRLAGKCCIITGAGSGMGKGIALAYAKEGARVVICARRVEMLEGTAAAAVAAGSVGTISVMQCDQSDAASVASVVTAAHAEMGKIDVLVNNAGMNIPKRNLAELSVEDFHRVVDVNLSGAFHFIHSVLPLMRAQKEGTVINISSIAGNMATVLAGTAYSASKFGMIALGNMINLEESANGIRATNICPGEAATEILDKRENPPSKEQRMKMVQPEDIGEIAVTVAALPQRVFIPMLTVTGITTIDIAM